MKVIKIVGFTNRERCPIAGSYLESFDFEAEDGRGSIEVTNDISKAQKFTDAAEAMSFWRTQSKTKPIREDGDPNRPFTASHVVIENTPN